MYSTCSTCGLLPINLNRLETENRKLKTENNKLKEENRKLKTENNKLKEELRMKTKAAKNSATKKRKCETC